tara:strand:+ start:173 stop:451 length:279 start_codon:yes stop_codon:yes gene_type:complete
MYTILDTNVYKLPDGKIWKGVPADLPSSSADLIAKAGKEYPTEWLKEQGALDKPKAKKAPAKKAPAKKAAPAKTKAQKPVEDKAAKAEAEDK